MVSSIIENSSDEVDQVDCTYTWGFQVSDMLEQSSYFIAVTLNVNNENTLITKNSLLI